MYRANDTDRDQSYFLFNTTREQLNFLRFPLGGLKKSETREIAHKLNLNVADKPDSQDICFVPKGDYASVIEKFRPNSYKKGNIKKIDGTVVGVHEGIINFTIGQRKGIKVADKEPLYVLEINPQNNEIIVGPKKNLIKRKIKLQDLNLLYDDKKELDNEFFVKVRSTGKLIKAKVELYNNSSDDLDLTITPNTLNALDVDIPSDTSSAAFWMVAACCHPDAEITIKNLGMNPTRIGVIEVLLNMGGKINQTNERYEGGEPVADLTVSSSKLESVEISGDLIPKLVDELPILSLAACFAEGKTIIKDAEE